MSSTQPQQKRPDHYVEAYQEIARLAFAAFGVTLMVSATASLLRRLKQGPTGFDDALPTLLHYAQDVRGTLAFFTAVLLLLCLTFFAEGSWLGQRVRTSILVPALRIAEHMFSLALGTFIAWMLIAIIGGDTTVGDLTDAAPKLGIGIALLAVFAIACATASVFLLHEYPKIVASANTFTYILIFVIAAGLVGSVYIDFLWRYEPGAALQH